MEGSATPADKVQVARSMMGGGGEGSPLDMQADMEAWVENSRSADGRVTRALLV